MPCSQKLQLVINRVVAAVRTALVDLHLCWCEALCQKKKKESALLVYRESLPIINVTTKSPNRASEWQKGVTALFIVVGYAWNRLSLPFKHDIDELRDCLILNPGLPKMSSYRRRGVFGIVLKQRLMAYSQMLTWPRHVCQQ